MVTEESPFSPSQIGFLFTFLARQLANNSGDNCITISKDLFSRVVDVLTDPGDMTQKVNSLKVGTKFLFRLPKDFLNFQFLRIFNFWHFKARRDLCRLLCLSVHMTV